MVTKLARHSSSASLKEITFAANLAARNKSGYLFGYRSKRLVGQPPAIADSSMNLTVSKQSLRRSPEHKLQKRRCAAAASLGNRSGAQTRIVAFKWTILALAVRRPPDPDAKR